MSPLHLSCDNVVFWQSADSDKPVQPPVKLRNSKWCSFSGLTLRLFKRLAKALIRLCICAGWSEALLVAHTTLMEISCHGSILLVDVPDKWISVRLPQVPNPRIMGWTSIFPEILQNLLSSIWDKLTKLTRMKSTQKGPVHMSTLNGWKPVFGVSNEVRFKPASSVTETSSKIEICSKSWYVTFR